MCYHFAMKTNLVVLCIDPVLGDSVAKLLADQLDMYFLNTTELFKFDHIPHTIEEFLETRKEKGFRELECGTIGYASTFYNTVMFVDSGVIKSKENVERLGKNAYFLFVKLDPVCVKKNLLSRIYENKVIKRFYNVSEKQLEIRQEKMDKIKDFSVNGNRKSPFKISADIIREINAKM